MWAVYFTITTFHLHAFFFICLCLLPSSSSVFKTPAHMCFSLFCRLQHKCEHVGQTVLPPAPSNLSQIVLRKTSEPPVSDSPVPGRTGCWATVSLLALCPMLWLLSPLACRALPLPRPEAAERKLKPAPSSPTKHVAAVAQDRFRLLAHVV